MYLFIYEFKYVLYLFIPMQLDHKLPEYVHFPPDPAADVFNAFVYSILSSL